MGGTYSDVTTETRNGRWCEMTKRGGLMPVVHHRVGPRAGLGWIKNCSRHLYNQWVISMTQLISAIWIIEYESICDRCNNNADFNCCKKDGRAPPLLVVDSNLCFILSTTTAPTPRRFVGGERERNWILKSQPFSQSSSFLQQRKRFTKRESAEPEIRIWYLTSDQFNNLAINIVNQQSWKEPRNRIHFKRIHQNANSILAQCHLLTRHKFPFLQQEFPLEFRLNSPVQLINTPRLVWKCFRSYLVSYSWSLWFK